MDWKNIKGNIGLFAQKATKKTEEIADIAAIKLKIAKLTSDRENEYLKLGKLTYRRLTCENVNVKDETADKISVSVEKITNISEEIKNLNLELEIKKQEADAKKKAKDTQKDDGFDEITIDTSVLDSFGDSEKTEI